MKQKATFDMSAFKQHAQDAIAVIQSIHEGTTVGDLTPVQHVSAMLKSLRLSKPTEFAVGIDDSIVETLRVAARSVKPRYAEKDTFRNFLGEIVGTTGKITNAHIDPERRLRAKQFLQSVAAA